MKEFYLRYFNVIFLTLAIAELCCVVYYPDARTFTKSSIMISLMAYYLWASPSLDWLFFSALFFAFLGDVFLLGEEYFLFGLGSFLFMQLLYSLCFYKQRGSLSIVKLIGIIVVVSATFFILTKLVPSLEEQMKIPVVVYASAIGLMAVTAIARKNLNNSYMLILTGVVSFLISDTVLGWSKFSNEIPFSGVLIMSTYILAQYLIIKGYLQYEYGNNGQGKSVLT